MCDQYLPLILLHTFVCFLVQSVTCYFCQSVHQLDVCLNVIYFCHPPSLIVCRTPMLTVGDSAGPNTRYYFFLLFLNSSTHEINLCYFSAYLSLRVHRRGTSCMLPHRFSTTFFSIFGIFWLISNLNEETGVYLFCTTCYRV